MEKSASNGEIATWNKTRRFQKWKRIFQLMKYEDSMLHDFFQQLNRQNNPLKINANQFARAMRNMYSNLSARIHNYRASGDILDGLAG